LFLDNGKGQNEQLIEIPQSNSPFSQCHPPSFERYYE
jgi:hypothetical protein